MTKLELVVGGENNSFHFFFHKLKYNFKNFHEKNLHK
jgi:hypothetical protein